MTAQEAKELRIGNKLLYKATNPFTGKEVTSEVYVTPFEIDAIYAKDTERHKYFPIPLTEEWLLKLGFESNPYQDRYEFMDIHVHCDKTKGEIMLWIEDAPHIRFAHQLQNYVYARKGVELTIK